ncbi:26S proteasome non-ATPase regulatory subunit 9 [Maniola hyperantus]|uniref:26S proteasome non-ATPase regulatory subunit 9 n=1 Tax=Aphantopus hyperantus TaxID=2795564 RepID=UPI0015691411|nr:26S proteasome non-ATPase regulatory subunit 9 [Maniola hyperantus]
MVQYNMDGPARDQVMKLIQEKDRIESDIREQNLVLEENNVGMQDSLVDTDGYPRNDVDVYKVRHARHRIICLQNDHKNIMKQIERGLSEVHSQFVANGEGTSRNDQSRSSGYTNGFAGGTSGVSAQSRPLTSDESFAVIAYVVVGSPADIAGLNENDELLEFGTINAINFTDVNQVNSLVQHSMGQPIQVRVRRGRHVLSLTVVPRIWTQPGLLGCRIEKKS